MKLGGTVYCCDKAPRGERQIEAGLALLAMTGKSYRNMPFNFCPWCGTPKVLTLWSLIKRLFSDFGRWLDQKSEACNK